MDSKIRAKIGIVVISDERPAIHSQDEQHNRDYLYKIKQVLEARAEEAGDNLEFIVEDRIINSMGLAVAAAKRMRAEDVAGV
ncbi:MAG: hypothetical protein GX047_04230, partial [Firmicutes bacterium]|nr:hypothetical protein [Bacillota bacterium]